MRMKTSSSYNNLLVRLLSTAVTGDASGDFASVAWPLLKQFHVPCVLFVTTNYASEPGRLFWWDALWQIVSATAADRLTVYRTLAWRPE